jgi:hypothetical protein
MGDVKVGDVCANLDRSDDVAQEDGFDCFRDISDGFRDRPTCTTN